MTNEAIQTETAPPPMREPTPSGRGNTRQQRQRQRTRRALLSAAAEVLGERGYLDTTVEHVLTRAGVSRAAIYAHFDGKLSLVCAIADDFQPKWRTVFDRLKAVDEPSIGDLEKWARRHMAFHRANQAICGLLTQVSSLEDRLYWQIAEQRNALIDDLGQHFSAFRLAGQHSAMRLRAQMLLTQMDETCFLTVRGRIPDPEGHAPRLIAEQLHAFLNSAHPEKPAQA